LQHACHIRRAAPTDAPAVIAGINALCVEGEAFYTTQFVPSPRWEAVLYRPEAVPDHLLAVAEWEGRFAGAGRLFPGAENTLFRHVAELGMFVLKAYRRRGIGHELLAWILGWAAESGLEKITLSVFATNQLAIQLYQRFGFVEEGRRRRQIKVGEQYLDELLMARFLNEVQ
jgi:RimJ/RimL family protein N-acetyltransferase